MPCAWRKKYTTLICLELPSDRFSFSNCASFCWNSLQDAGTISKRLNSGRGAVGSLSTTVLGAKKPSTTFTAVWAPWGESVAALVSVMLTTDTLLDARN